MRISVHFFVVFSALMLIGCSTTGNVGMITKSTADPGKLLKIAQDFEEIGKAEGEACRYFALAIIPWGGSDVAEAVDDALAESGGDALLNVSVSSSLYGFIPLYNIFSYTCTKVRGIAIKFL